MAMKLKTLKRWYEDSQKRDALTWLKRGAEYFKFFKEMPTRTNLAKKIKEYHKK